MRLKKKIIVHEEPIDIISNYLCEVDEIKNKMIKNNIVRYDVFDEKPIEYDEDIINWMCSFTVKDFI